MKISIGSLETVVGKKAMIAWLASAQSFWKGVSPGLGVQVDLVLLSRYWRLAIRSTSSALMSCEGLQFLLTDGLHSAEEVVL